MTKSKKQFPRILFGVDQYPNCCGIGVIHGLYGSEKEERLFGGKTRTNRGYKEFETEKEQAEDFVTRAEERISDDCDGYNYAQIALVSKYHSTTKEDRSNSNAIVFKEGTGQYPHIQKELKTRGWEAIATFINPNHDHNEITVYQKYFPDRVPIKEYGEDDEW